MPKSRPYHPRHSAVAAADTSTGATAASPTSAGRPTPLWRRLALVVPVLGTVAATAISGLPASATTSTAATSAASGGQIFFGVDGAASKAANVTAMSLHTYSQINRNVPNARMITMGTGGLHWNQISAAQPGSSTYNNLVNWARTLKARTGPILLTFSHEPEATAKRGWGGSSEYVRAFQHVVNIFRSQGVNNVEWTWQMTGNAFRVSPSDARYANKWYPGDAYVDNVAGDVYNWYNCRGSGGWTELSTVAAPMLAFARAHGKKAVLAEYASDSGPQRAQWLRNVQQYLIANANTYRGVYYFDHPNNTACNWALTSSTDISTFLSIARDPHFTR